MSIDRIDSTTADEINGDITPSTASRVKPVPVENAFPTPPRREHSNSYKSGRQSPAPSRLFAIGKPSSGPTEHKSVEALRATLTRGFGSGRSSVTEFDKPTRKEPTQRKSQLFDQAFAVRESYYSAKERVSRDSVLIVELKMNRHLEEDKSLLNDLLMLLSETYYKPSHNITICVNTDHHIMIGTSQDPAYFMSVMALANDIAPMKNLRATKIVQEFLAETLQIPAQRGIIVFNTIKEEDFGVHGTTVAAEIGKIQIDEKRSINLRSRQSNRLKRGSNFLSTSEAMHLEKGKCESYFIQSSEEFGDDTENVFSVENPVRTASSAGKKLQGKKSVLSFWKKGPTTG